MVRVYDPERTDPTVRFFKGIYSFFNESLHSLSSKEIQSALQVFLKDDYYKNMFQQYSDKNEEFPDIIIKNNCKKGQYFLSPQNYPNQYFKASYDPNQNSIQLCSNLMLNVLEFKENLDRELIMAYDYKILKKQIYENNEEFSCTQMRACRAEIANYTNFDEKTMSSMTNICSRFLTKHKGPNINGLPTDIWVRYVEKINEKNQFCLNIQDPFIYKN